MTSMLITWKTKKNRVPEAENFSGTRTIPNRKKAHKAHLINFEENTDWNPHLL